MKYVLRLLPLSTRKIVIAQKITSVSTWKWLHDCIAFTENKALKFWKIDGTVQYFFFHLWNSLLQVVYTNTNLQRELSPLFRRYHFVCICALWLIINSLIDHKIWCSKISSSIPFISNKCKTEIHDLLQYTLKDKIRTKITF